MVAARVICAFIILISVREAIAVASISSSMIVEVREITSVSPSPDGTRVVIGVCHPNPQTNTRELSWVIVPLRGAGMPITIPAGEGIWDPHAPGTLLNRQAQWSGDGKWFFYLRREGREVQLWKTRSNGQMTRQVTHSKSDLIGLAASSHPNEFIVQLAPDRDALQKIEDEEQRNGILYDDHIIGGFPLTETLPFIDRWRSLRKSASGWLPPGWSETSNAVFDVRRGELKALPGNISDASTASGSEGVSYRATVVALGQIPPGNSSNYPGQYTLQVEPKTTARPAVKCAIAECIANQITILGWSSDQTEVYYVADSMQGRLGPQFPGHAAIYAWNPAGNIVRLIHALGGRLYNLDTSAGLTLALVPIIDHEIVVAAAGADEPPLLEAVNLASGISRVLFDPNAELRALTRGRAVWHKWPTSSAYPGRGVIILPDDYQPGRRYPAVITTYTCGNGFLRGGNEDNVPEFVAAHQGFVAICVDVTVREILARETDFSQIYPIMCDIVAGVIADQAKNGILDPTRVGLSGQSLGANAGAYCISHSNAFAAAAFRHGSAVERATWELFDTAPSRRDRINGIYAMFHMPDPRSDPTGRWEKISIASKARDINTPLLIQNNDSEYFLALPLWSALHEEGKPIEMYVFPKETHALTQPIHELINYERQLDWFRFWLKREEDPSPFKRDQYVRWKQLRDSFRSVQSQH